MRQNKLVPLIDFPKRIPLTVALTEGSLAPRLHRRVGDDGYRAAGNNPRQRQTTFSMRKNAAPESRPAACGGKTRRV
jgi:hypothetical protein